MKPEPRELPAIANLFSAPQVGQAPSLAEEISPQLKKEPTRRQKIDIARVAPSASLLIRPSEKPKPKPLPRVRQLIPSAQRLARLRPRKEEGTARELPREETVSLNTKQFKYYSYFVKLKHRIENVWNYPYEAQVQGQQGELFMEFSITRNGALERTKLLRSSQYTVLDVEALRAVRVALESPLPLPKEWGLDRINVRASFNYQLNFWNPIQ
ncbi:MAG: TonB family protein [Thermodesulfobacteriota bacterium]